MSDKGAASVETYVDKDEVKKRKRKILKYGDGEVGRDILHMIKSRYKLLYIESCEESRVINCFKDIAIAENINLYQWDVGRGLIDSLSSNAQQVVAKDSEVHDDPVALLGHIYDHAQSDKQKMTNKQESPDAHIYMLLDFHHYLDGIPQTERLLKNFAQLPSLCVVVIVAPVFVCPPSLDKEVTLVPFPYPSSDELGESLDKLIREVPTRNIKARETADEKREELIKSASGLTLTEAENAFAKTLVKDRDFVIQTILDEKRQIIRKGGILEYRDPRFSFEEVGGLDILQEWIDLHRLAFKDDAAEFGLPAPKGLLLMGVPGTGKSMSCDAIASAYEMPLLRLDIGSIFSSHVGESEANMRKCIAISEAIAPCILWVDEVEKGIGGVQSSNATDGGVTNRVFGTFLTWMQDKEDPVFVVCTANTVQSIPPEFMRAGRFDEVFFLDIPDFDQRCDVIEKIITRKGRDSQTFCVDDIATASENYTPVEIEKAINNALFRAYYEKKRGLLTEDVVSEIGKFQPLYNSRREDIDNMRIWALGDKSEGGRAVVANSTKRKKRKKKRKIEKEPNRSIDLEEDEEIRAVDFNNDLIV